jgi:hypothetical protein
MIRPFFFYLCFSPVSNKGNVSYRLEEDPGRTICSHRYLAKNGLTSLSQSFCGQQVDELRISGSLS